MHVTRQAVVQPGTTSQTATLLQACYLIGVLALCYVFSYIDRIILALLVQPIQRDLGLSDVQISLLHGFAFMLTYSVMALPMGWLADRKNRVLIITIGVAAWSVLTAACGLVKSFWHFFLARFGVGIGEAALNPAAYSLIADTMPRHLLSRAYSVYLMGGIIGSGLAFLLGGTVVGLLADVPTTIYPFIGQIFAWQWVFLILGILGLLMAAVVWGTLREPPRPQEHDARKGGVSLLQVWHFFKRNAKTYVLLTIAFKGLAITVSGLLMWVPSFFHRQFAWTIPEVATVFGTALIVLGVTASYAGGWLSDHLRQGGRLDAPVLVIIGIAALALIPLASFPLMPTAVLAWACLFLGLFPLLGPWGIAIYLQQQYTPSYMFAQVCAVNLFLGNLLGMAVGPTLVALVADHAFQGPQALGYALSCVCGGALLLTLVCVSWGRKYYIQSVQRHLETEREAS